MSRCLLRNLETVLFLTREGSALILSAVYYVILGTTVSKTEWMRL